MGPHIVDDVGFVDKVDRADRTNLYHIHRIRKARPATGKHSCTDHRRRFQIPCTALLLYREWRWDTRFSQLLDDGGMGRTCSKATPATGAGAARDSDVCLDAQWQERHLTLVFMICGAR